jgi:hypothetical protein
MQLRIYKHIYLGPWIRLNIFNRGISISCGHRSMGWFTIGPPGFRETLDTPIPGVYLTETQRFKDLQRKLRKSRS